MTKLAEPYDPTDWHRNSAIATYPGFNSYSEASGERMRFVIDAKLEHPSEVAKLRRYIDCLMGILELDQHTNKEDDIDWDWAE